MLALREHGRPELTITVTKRELDGIAPGMAFTGYNGRALPVVRVEPIRSVLVGREAGRRFRTIEVALADPPAKMSFIIQEAM